MPGEAIQRVWRCGREDRHEAHPMPTDGDPDSAALWCSGDPATDGPGATASDAYDPASATAVALAGELRDVRERVKREEARLLTDDVAAPADRPASRGLRAESYAVVVHGIECRVDRRDKKDPVQAWWAAHVGNAWAHETTVFDQENHRPAAKAITTDAVFDFDPHDPDDEQGALERAGRYCELVALTLARLRQQQGDMHRVCEEDVRRALLATGGKDHRV